MLRAATGRPLAYASATNLSLAFRVNGGGFARLPCAISHVQPLQPVRYYQIQRGRSRSSARPFTRPGTSDRRQTTRGQGFEEFANSEEIIEGTADKQETYVTRFEDLTQVNPVIVDILTKRMGLETMTPVQSQTIGELMGGIDIIAQARTGTGKTLAFLVPIINKILTNDPGLERSMRRSRGMAPDVRALIISPTRELAEQIADEARRSVAGTGIKVQSAVGGTQKRSGLRKIMMDGCHILVGTPGRLHDILSDPDAGISVGQLNAFVLDEADRLLDAGFLPDIQRIEALLPPREQRQNMLFSATVPREVLGLSRKLLNDNSRFVQTIQAGETQTHEKIPQKIVKLRGMENSLPALLELMSREIHREGRTEPFKAMVFCNSNAETMLYAEIFASLQYNDPTGKKQSFDRTCQVLEIHSRLSQMQRSEAASIFKRAKSAVLFSSDVSARGMDYPNVTHVIQMGLARTREFYIHRLGRTGRGDKTGEGWLFAHRFDMGETPRRLANLPLDADETLQSASADLTGEAALTPEVKSLHEATQQSAFNSPNQLKVDAYKAAFGHLGWVMNRQALVDELNATAQVGWGMEQPPTLAIDWLRKMRLQGLRGINVSRREAVDRDDPFGSGYTRPKLDRAPDRQFAGRGRDSSSFGRGRDSSSFGRSRDSSSFGRDRDSSAYGRGHGGSRSVNVGGWETQPRRTAEPISDFN